VKDSLARWNEDDDWETLLLAISLGQCTPFLGAGACAGVLPLGSELAREWAREFGYPFQDTENLSKVSQYLAVKKNSLFPKWLIKTRFENVRPPDFSNPNEPHRLVADLHLPLYITTNYDNFLFRAIESTPPRRQPIREFCRWNTVHPSKRGPSGVNPTSERPVVFHLHGIMERPATMVLTEDDYLDFMKSDPKSLMPIPIMGAFADSCLLFLGYSFEDMNFKVIFRKLATYMMREGARHVSVQLAPKNKNAEPTTEELKQVESQIQYLQQQYNLMSIQVYWGTCEQFAIELRRRR